ncbi:MAG: FixH family protein [Bacteroidetes bacterium]|nr:FixH family protein [Bacteroidota bacterium]
MKNSRNSRWGIGLLSAFVLFVVGVGVMVFTAVTKRVDLVTDDYYERGLRHEAQIQTVQRTRALAEQVSVHAEKQTLTVQFPRQFVPDVVRGEVMLYRPSDRRLDATVVLRLDSLGYQRISTERLKRGLWKVQVSWAYQDVQYYTEKPVVVR